MLTLRAAALAITLALCAAPAGAQQIQTGFADFGADQDAPIEIEADALEVQDQENIAVFTGNVTARQGDTALRTARLTVVYGPGRAGADAPATPQNRRISRLLADGDVLIAADGQSATGRSGTVNFDARTLALSGNVTLSQEGNIVTGDELTVDLNTGIARVNSSSRVRVLITPGGN